MYLKVSFVLTAALAVALFCVNPTANATTTEVMGGPGGGAFVSRCASGEVVRGFKASTGAWVDGMAVLCSPYRNGKTMSTHRSLRWVAGTSGAVQEVYCGSRSPVTGLLLTHTRGRGLKRQYVNSIGLICDDRGKVQTCVSSGEGCGALAPAQRGLIVRTVKDYANDWVRCPADEVLVGVRGRHGAFVDAIGLICARVAS